MEQIANFLSQNAVLAICICLALGYCIGKIKLGSFSFGATIGTLSAQAVVNHFVYNAAEPDWSAAWYVFAGYALVVTIAFMILFKEPKDNTKLA